MHWIISRLHDRPVRFYKSINPRSRIKQTIYFSICNIENRVTQLNTWNHAHTIVNSICTSYLNKNSKINNHYEKKNADQWWIRSNMEADSCHEWHCNIILLMWSHRCSIIIMVKYCIVFIVVVNFTIFVQIRCTYTINDCMGISKNKSSIPS
jgi:hypothetical protein